MDDDDYRLDLHWPDAAVSVPLTPKPLRAHRRRVRPARPDPRSRPRLQTGPWSSGTGETPPTPQDDRELWAVFNEIRRLDPLGVRAGYALREALDQIYDGQ